MTIDDDTLEELVAAPKKTVTDEGSVEERPIMESIEAQQYIDGRNAAEGPLFGIRIAKCKPGGAA